MQAAVPGRAYSQAEHRVEIEPFQRRDAVVVLGHYRTCGVELAHDSVVSHFEFRFW